MACVSKAKKPVAAADHLAVTTGFLFLRTTDI
jgi:hypothetical protein